MNPDYVVCFLAGVLLTVIVFVFSQVFKAWYDEKRRQIRELEEEYFSWKRKIREVEDMWQKFEYWQSTQKKVKGL